MAKLLKDFVDDGSGDKLPVEYPFKDAMEIYGRRLKKLAYLVVFTAAAFGLILSLPIIVPIASSILVATFIYLARLAISHWPAALILLALLFIAKALLGKSKH